MSFEDYEGRVESLAKFSFRFQSLQASAADMQDFRGDLKSYLDEKLGKMQENITRIKARIGMS